MRNKMLFLTVATAALISSVASVFGQEVTHDGMATVLRLKGKIEYREGDAPWRKLKKRVQLHPGVVIRSDAASQADISVNGWTSWIRLLSDTTVQIQKMRLIGLPREGDYETFLDLKSGSIFGNVKKVSAGSSYQIHTPMGTAAIRGTDFEIEAKTNSTGAESVAFTAIAGQVACVAEVNGETVTRLLVSGETWMPGDGDVRQLSRDEIYAKPFSDFLGTILIVCPQAPPPPKVAEVWHVLCAPAH